MAKTMVIISPVSSKGVKGIKVSHYQLWGYPGIMFPGGSKVEIDNGKAPKKVVFIADPFLYRNGWHSVVQNQRHR